MSNYENLLTDENIGEYVNNAGPESEGEPEQSLTANGDNLTGTGEAAGNTGMFGVDNSLPSNSIAKEVPANVVANTPSTETPTSALVEPQTTSPDPGVLNEDVYVPTEVLPSYATLWWVGYNFQREDKKLYIEIMTKGEPQYEIFQERNQASQPELVLRLLSTVMRPK